MFVDLPVDMFGQDSYAGEQAPEHVELLGEQFYSLLQSFVLLEEYFDLLLRLPRSHFRLLPTLPHRNVVPLPSPPVLVTVLVTGLHLFSRRVMVHHRRLALHGADLLLVHHSTGGEGGEGCPVRASGVGRTLHVTAGKHVDIARSPEVLGVHGFFLDDSAAIARSRAVGVAAGRLVVAGIRCTAMNRLGHVRQRRSGVIGVG